VRKWVVALVALAGIGLAAVAVYGLVLREEPLARSQLVEALLQAPDENRLTDVFARFVPVKASLDEQVPALVASGFRCGINPANVDGSTYLTCDRPIEGTGYCRGFRYYSYQTATGEIIDVLGSAFDRTRDRNVLGRCEDLRQHFFALTNEVGQLRQSER